MITTQILIIGSGGREHALAKQYAASDHVSHVWVAPGNPAMIQPERDSSAAIDCVDIGIEDFESLCAFVKENEIQITFVGPEIPLNSGIVDKFRKEGLKIIGPTKQASQLEASKGFAKGIMNRAGVQTAAYQSFDPTQFQEASRYLSEHALPVVLKEDGLAQGKGVIIATTRAEAEQALEKLIIEQESSVIIEEFLTGKEFSYFCLVNEEHIISIGTACDYKRAFDNDEGLNTGGMGAYAPVDWVDENLIDEIHTTIIQPVIQKMIEENTPFTGVLYAGLMQTEKGLYVIEFNTRFGDPETQILLPLLETDFYELTHAHLEKQDISVNHSLDYGLGVVIAANGYPESYQTGMPIKLLDTCPVESICFSGVKREDSKQFVSDGGRILMMTAKGRSLSDCRDSVYKMIEKVSIPDTFYRRDIGLTE